jgi:hypothetical protein
MTADGQSACGVSTSKKVRRSTNTSLTELPLKETGAGVGLLFLSYL